MGLVALLAGGIGMATLLLLLHGTQTARLLGPVSFIAVALACFALLRAGREWASLKLAIYGSWAVATGIMMTSGGVLANTVIMFPLIILMAGWLLGSRAATTVAALSSLAVLAVATRGAVHEWPSSPFLYWLADSVVFALSVAVIVYFRRAQRVRLEEVRALAADLAKERAQAEMAETLRQNNDLLDRTGRLARIGGWELDVDSGKLTWTAGTFRIHDLEPGAPPDRDRAIAFYPPECRDVISEAVNQAIRAGTAYDLELPLITARGRKIWVRTIGEPQYENGRVVRLSGAVQDITEHRLADEQLQNSLNNLQRTLEATDDGIFGYDGTDPSGKLLFANKRFFEIWKIPPEKAATTTRADIIAAARRLFADPDAGEQRIREILAMGAIHEDKVFLNDGRILFRRSVPLSEGSQVSRVWSFRDITAEENAKTELIASRDDAQRANAAKSEFLSRMSHELRTPMHAIMGMITLAQRSMPDPKGLEQLHKARAAADHLLSIINDILDISKIEAGRLVLEHVEFRIADILRNLETLIVSRAEEKGLDLAIDCDEATRNLVLCGDPLRLSQILLNLAGNAIKFSQRGRVIVQATCEPGNAIETRLRFAVSDQGIGISSDNLQRIFASFEQADGSTTRRYGGTGLGLAISKRLVRAMGGEIGVDSRLGEGSTFWFVVPLTRPDQLPGERSNEDLPASAEDELRRRFRGARVLLVDDDPVGREVAHLLLLGIGLLVDLADNGEQALAMARNSRYDLIMMDMRMPGMDGLEATRAIRADSLNTATPIVAITANAFDDDRKASLEAGLDDHISKPLLPEKLFESLLRWLGSDRPRA